jgi:hypothetical protein
MRETIWTVVLAAPVSAALLTILAWLLRSWIMVRLTGSIKQEYDKALESHKAMLRKEVETELANQNAELKSKMDIRLETHKTELKARIDTGMELLKVRVQKKFHISKSQFDVELASSQSVWETVSAVVDGTVRILCLYDRVETKSGKGEKRVYADKADASYCAAAKVVQNTHPFLPQAIHEHAAGLIRKCKTEIDYFYLAIKWEESNEETYNQDEARKNARETLHAITSTWEKLADLIRDRLLDSARLHDEGENVF